MSTALGSDDRRDRPIPSIVANELVAASAAHPADKVIIAGTDQLELLIALLRQGCSNIDCRSPECGPHPRAGAMDVVIAPAVRSEAELRHTLHRFGFVLRPRGVFMVLEASPHDMRNERRLRQIFFEAGFAAVERVPSRSGFGQVWRAYKQTAAMAHAA
jgi:hypothetical protein